PALSRSGEDPNGLAYRDPAGPRGSRHDGPYARDGKTAIDRETEEIFRVPANQAGGTGSKPLSQELDSCTSLGRDGNRRVELEPTLAKPLRQFLRYQLCPVGLDQIDLGEHRYSRAHPELLEDGEVLLGLGHDAFVGRNHEQCEIDAGCS